MIKRYAGEHRDITKSNEKNEIPYLTWKGIVKATARKEMERW